MIDTYMITFVLDILLNNPAQLLQIAKAGKEKAEITKYFKQASITSGATFPNNNVSNCSRKITDNTNKITEIIVVIITN